MRDHDTARLFVFHGAPFGWEHSKGSFDFISNKDVPLTKKAASQLFPGAFPFKLCKNLN